MTTHPLSHELHLPIAACTLGTCSLALLTGAIGTDLLATPPVPAMVCGLLFGSFLAIALAQKPRQATAQIVVKVPADRAAEQASPAAVVTPVKKAA